MQTGSRDNLKDKCNFCGGLLLTVKISNDEIKIHIRVKKVKRVCRDCSMEYEDFVIP